MSTIEATARSAMKYLKPGAIVPVDVQTTAILVNALREALTSVPDWASEAIEQPAQQCKWPTCQSEEYQQALAEQIKRELVGEQPAQQALDKKAENARELGLDYEPLAGTQVSKVWWDGEKLMAEPIPFVEFYKPAPVATGGSV